jgi:hypothetical protein
MDDAALLHALVVAATDDLAVADEDGPNGDSSGGEALLCLVNGGLEKRIRSSRNSIGTRVRHGEAYAETAQNCNAGS